MGVQDKILAEVARADLCECRAYLLGALRDGTFNRLHGTTRISQAGTVWLKVLQALFARLGSRSWIYREGKRNVWVVETVCWLSPSALPLTNAEKAAFVRGYFDAEGGIPHRPADRFYIQMVQKDHSDLDQVRHMLEDLSIRCGAIHNPSRRVDPNYWRFYVRAHSHADFARRIGSWHPRKRMRLALRFQAVTADARGAGTQGASAPPPAGSSSEFAVARSSSRNQDSSGAPGLPSPVPRHQ